MKLNIKAVAIAEAVVAGALFVLCRLAFALAPEATLTGLKYLTHIDWSSVAMPVNWKGFLSGLVVFTLLTAVIGAAWAWIYNLLARQPETHPLEEVTT
jgi:hypothetical protein